MCGCFYNAYQHMMMPHATEPESTGGRGPSAALVFAAVWGWLLAGAYVCAGLWFARDRPWQADAMPTIALVIGWLVYAFSWPVQVVRPWLWVGLGLLQLALLAYLGLTGLALGVSVLHVLAFDPRWLRPRIPAEPEALFYDGMCGLCHRWVKRVVRADRAGVLFYFAPLQGHTIERVLTPGQRAALPDSIVVRTMDGRVLVKSQAIGHILDALGGWYRLIGIVMRALPRPVRDMAYDGVANVRHKLFARPAEACPMVRAELRGRFRG